jgi:hypothetical protein
MAELEILGRFRCKSHGGVGEEDGGARLSKKIPGIPKGMAAQR